VSWVTENRIGHEELAEMGFGKGCSELSLLERAGGLEWFTKKWHETPKQTTTSGSF
jgi:hypothetical protein